MKVMNIKNSLLFLLLYSKIDLNKKIKGEFLMELYHASGETVEFPKIRKNKFTKDFS